MKEIDFNKKTNTSERNKKLETSVLGASRDKNGKRKVKKMPQIQTAALPRHQDEEEIDKTRQTYAKH